MISRMSFGRGSLGRRLIWSQGHLVARSCGRGAFGRRHLDARSFSRVVIRSHGYLVAGHLVALNEKSILTYLQK
jgi:hypothetical protein